MNQPNQPPQGPWKRRGVLKCALRAEGGTVIFKGPYNPEWIQDIKTEINSSSRKFNPETKEWNFGIEVLEDVHTISQRHYDEVTVIAPDVKEIEVPMLVSSSDDPYALVLRSAPDAILKKCMTLVQASLHPDQGGDVTLSARVNAAVSDIKKERGL